jgi:hypothetical protein
MFSPIKKRPTNVLKNSKNVKSGQDKWSVRAMDI